jgi:hypothetical protein
MADNQEREISDHPGNRVLAVIDAEKGAEPAVHSLEESGLPIEQVKVYHSDEAVENIDATGERSGLWGRITKTFAHGDENRYLKYYEDEARNGCQIVSVIVNDEAEAERVRDVLLEHNARDIRYFGKLTITDLTPPAPSGPA